MFSLIHGLILLNVCMNLVLEYKYIPCMISMCYTEFSMFFIGGIGRRKFIIKLHDNQLCRGSKLAEL